MKNILGSINNPPAFDSSSKIINIQDEIIENYFSTFLGKEKEPNKISINQTISVASSSIDFLGESAKPIYQWLIDNNLSAFIPIDNLDMIING